MTWFLGPKAIHVGLAKPALSSDPAPKNNGNEHGLHIES